MLVIRRRAGQSLTISGGIEIEVIEIGAGKVKLGITAPREVLVLRKEIDLTRGENLAAARGWTREGIGRLLAQVRPVGDPVGEE